VKKIGRDELGSNFGDRELKAPIERLALPGKKAGGKLAARSIMFQK